MAREFRFRRLIATDFLNKALKAFEQLSKSQYKQLMHFRVSTNLMDSHVSLNSIQCDAIGTNQSFGELVAFCEANDFIEITLLTFNLQSASTIEIRQPMGQFFGSLVMERTSNQPLDSDLRFLKTIVEIFSSNFDFVNSLLLTKETMETETATLLETYNQHIINIENLSAKQIAMVANNIDKWEQSILQITEKLENKFQEKHQSLEMAYKEKDNDLQKREEELKKKIEQLDDRDRIHARRAIYKEMKEKAMQESEIKISDATIGKRLPIRYTFFALIGLSVCSAIYFGAKAWGSNDISIPLSVSILTAFGFLLYYLRWENHWFNLHSQAELANQKYKNDVLRANWLTEMIYEGKESSNNEIPTELLEAFARNIFSVDPTHDQPKHPLEDLASLLKSVKSVKVEPTGIQLEKK